MKVYTIDLRGVTKGIRDVKRGVKVVGNVGYSTWVYRDEIVDKVETGFAYVCLVGAVLVSIF